jgi:hypothetical protein
LAATGGKHELEQHIALNYLVLLGHIEILARIYAGVLA